MAHEPRCVPDALGNPQSLSRCPAHTEVTAQGAQGAATTQQRKAIMSELIPHPDPFDYRHVITRFTCGLVALRNHIERHNLIEDAPEVCAEIDGALALFALIDDSEALDYEPEWSAAWDYVRDNMQKWWD